MLAVFCAVLIGCEKQNELSPEAEKVYDGTVFIGENSLESKLTLGQESAGVVPALWESGDAIKIYNDAQTLITSATLQSGAGTGKGTFLCDQTIATGTKVRVIYPSTAEMGGKHNVPATQTQAAAGSKAISAYTFAYSDEIQVGVDPNTFTLHHVPAYVRVKISSSAYAGYKLNSLVFQCEGAKIAGNFELDYEAGKVYNLANSSDKVTVTLSNPLTISTSSQEVWLVALPADLAGKAVTITLNMKDNSSVDVQRVLKFTGKAFESNKVYSLKITDPTLDWIDEADKSKEEYTNVTTKWKTSLSAEYSDKVTRMATGMNWMDKVKSGYSYQDKWGGAQGIKPDYILSTNPEGFWRVGRYGGRSVMVDPDGNIAVLRGLNNVSPEPYSEASTATSSSLYNSKFSTDLAFAQQAGQWMDQYQFNLFSSNCKRILLYRENTDCVDKATNTHYMSPEMENAIRKPSASHVTSQIENLYFMRTFWYDYYSLTGKSSGKGQPILALLFDPYWLEYIDGLAAQAAEWFKDSPEFVGYFFDNELPVFGVGSGAFTEYTLSLKNMLECTDGYLIADGEPRFKEYAFKWTQNWMQTNYGTTTYSAEMEDAYVKAVCEYYFKTCTEAIRRHDPNHLVLGTRICTPHRKNEIYMRAAAKYCDVVSINYYDNEWEYSDTDAANYASWFGNTPFMVTEFYVKGMDVQTTNEGAGNFVATQKDRGQWYNNSCIKMIQKGNCAGWMWFKFWNDTNSDGTKWVNKGIVKLDMSGLYTDCTDLMLDLNRNSVQILKYYSNKDAGTSDNYAGTLPSVEWVD